MRLRSLLAVSLLWASPLLAGPELDPLRTIAVQDGGRVKPFDTFARETARRVGGARAFGAESMAGLEPTEWMVAMMADPEHWRGVPMIRVAKAELRTLASLAHDRDRFSFDELVADARLMAAFEALEAKTDGKLSPTEEALSSLYDTLSRLSGIFSRQLPRLLPGESPKAAWRGLADPGADTRAGLLASSVLSAHRGGDRELVTVSASALARRLSDVGAAAYPSAAVLEREVSYNRLKPFRMAWLFYLVGAGLAFAALAVGAASRWVFVPMIAGLGVHTYGLMLRTLISERAPVTNMYETVVFVAWGAVLLALVLEWRQRVFYAAGSAAVLAVSCLVIADSVPIMDGAIGPLVPVLRDNFWLTTHVLTISLGYAALLLATGLAHIVLVQWLLSPARATRSSVPRLLYRSLQAGTLLLAAGTLLGGVWASYSWGRFWGWDPKETWALIALLGYLSLLHARSAGLVRELGMAVGSVVAFLGVLMAWYGVNFVLGTGLHSYGFGAGGVGYVAGFAVAEVVIAIAAIIVWRRRNAAAPAPAHGALARG
jgi:ABC-type transport system involved in cytochrome c biogenesis permease subunit